jgi:putative FmdB family regulatory protein
VALAEAVNFGAFRGLNCAFFEGSVSGMPTYEYHCQKCDKNFEMFQSMRDQPLRECPENLCRLPKWGHGKVKRLLGTGAGIIFKGSGFYTTDYRSKAYQDAAKKEAPTAAGEKSGAGKESKTSPEKTSTSAPPTKPKKEPAA